MALGTVTVLVLAVVLGCPPAAAAGSVVMVGGRAAAPLETNFAGHRHASPTHRVVVQVNHDTRSDVTLDLTAIDDAYRAVRAQQKREPLFPIDTLPLVVISAAKMRKFMDGPQRLLFGKMDVEVRKQEDVYPSPNAIFISDVTLPDPPRFRRALELSLGYFFDAEFHRAVGGLDQARPRPAD